MSSTEKTMMKQEGRDNKQAGRDINIKEYHFNFPLDFDVFSFEELINEINDHLLVEDQVEKNDFLQIDIEKKNRLNELELYFNEIIQEDVVYFNPLHTFIENNDENFRNKFKHVVRTIRSLVIGDGNVQLTQDKIKKIMQNIYLQDWTYQKRQYALILIHYLYFVCLIGKKEE